MPKTVLSAADRQTINELFDRILARNGSRTGAVRFLLGDQLDLGFSVTDSSATPGAATHSTPAGVASIAAGVPSVVITNPLVKSDTVILAVVQFTDATLFRVDRVVPGSGSFTIIGNANATANTKVAYVLMSNLVVQA